MKKNITILLFFLCMGLKAQWVDIASDKFGNWLNSNGYSACLRPGNNTTWQLDTTCNTMLNATSVNYVFSLPNYDEDLTGIEYFRNLDSLTLGYSNLTMLPPLPQSLTYFQFQSEMLTTIGLLPTGLKTLICWNTPLVSLDNLPAGLKYLDCQGDSLAGFLSLPDSLEYLECSNNNLISLPSLPPFLKTLNCPYNKLTALPALPDGLQTLYCCYNHQISELPALPNGLKVLKVNYLNLTNVPTLPDSLINFDPDHNNITTLPALPAGLRVLQIYNNPITELPELPAGLNTLNADSCQLTSVPVVPASIQTLSVAGNSINFIGNLPDTLFRFDCRNNPALTCLPAFYKISTLYFFNTSVNCVPPHGEISFSSPNVEQYPICDSVNNPCNAINSNANEIYTNVLKVYPNPIEDIVHIKLQRAYESPVTICITNMLGQTVFKQTESTSATTLQITLGNIPKGIYLLEVITDGKRVVINPLIK